MKFIWKPILLSAAMLFAAGCGIEETCIGDDCGDSNVLADLEGDITEDATLELRDEPYVLKGRVTVKDGATLTIEPGVVIQGTKEPLGWLQIERGGKLVAEGTALQPIVFTSNQEVGSRERGDWGGVVILGKASNNIGSEVELEGNGGTHGGSDDSDSSGSLKYVRIEYAGWELGPDNELNGLTLGSVGNGTKLSYVQVHAGLDDGIEWFGGTANGTNLVVSGVADDCFDTDEGYRGVVQWAVCLQENGIGDNGVEASSNADSIDQTPRAMPQFANFTFIGRGDYESGKGHGLRFKEGTAANFTNGVVINFAAGGFDADNAVDANASNSDGSTVDVQNTIFFANRFTQQTVESEVDGKVFTQFGEDDDEVDESAYITTESRGNMLADPKLGSIAFASPNPLPASNSPARDCGEPGSVFATGGAYCGAFSDSNWMEGWTKFVDEEDPSVVEVSGSILEDTTWTADTIYVLSGRVSVEEGVTLTIEPGTKIAGKKEPLGWLQIQRGAMLDAEGTADKPIVFTSAAASPQAGDWGGIVILGESINNLGTDVELEGNGGFHGGNVANSNSGVLQYVRVEYAGWELGPDNELNGITLGSVGSGTTISYVQVHRGLDDGIEWFGGTANADHVVVSAVLDDCFDTDEGYQGMIQFAVCAQDGAGDNGVEASSNADNVDQTPRANVQISNFTFVGRGDYATGKGNGLRFKDGTQGTAINGVIVGFVDSGIDLDHMTDGKNADDSTIDLQEIILFNNTTDSDASVADNISNDNDDTDELSFMATTATTVMQGDPQLGNTTFGSSMDLLPDAASIAVDGTCGIVPTGFGDETADYCGAFDASNWMSGWTNFQ